MHCHLTNTLHQAQLISLVQADQIAAYCSHSGASTAEAIIALNILDANQLTTSLSQYFGLDIISLQQYNYSALCAELGLRELITQHQALPISKNDTTLVIAIIDPSNNDIEEEFSFATGLRAELALADPIEILSAIRKIYGRLIDNQTPPTKEINTQELEELVEISDDELNNLENLSQDNSPISCFINQILLDAVRKEASDIHFEPYEDYYRVRMRCDGMLIETLNPPHHLARRLAARIKILSKLNIAERRLPQDGRIKLKLNEDTAVNLRVSSLPTLWGEKMVLRLLDSNDVPLNIDNLGYSDKQKHAYLKALNRPQGLILMTGPTGSGKTVSLYTGLKILNTVDVNIATAEDPIEINLPGINQVQIKPDIGFDFSTALKAFLRQDPDVIMVGEIRDFETAEIAIKAAQTGHLVLSTLHTNSAAETLVRLSNMGIQSFHIASSLTLIIAQRLARRLCSYCKVPYHPAANSIAHFNLPQHTQLFEAHPRGCNHCNNGYSGRIGIYEVMEVNGQLPNAIVQHKSAEEIEKIACSQGMLTLSESGIEKWACGVTSYSELQRTLYL